MSTGIHERNIALRPEDYLPRMPHKRDQGIGIIGLGGVARNAHLPAYRAAGFHVAAGADPVQELRAKVTSDFGIEQVHADYHYVLDNPAVTIVDVTLPNTVAERAQIIHDAIDAGKHLLVQKPFAHSLAEAVAFVEHAERTGVLLAVNQNGRWNPSYRAARTLIRQGSIGTPYFITHEMRIDQDAFSKTPWLLNLERSVLVEYSVHHLDILRQWAGREPTGVMAMLARRPQQRSRGEMLAVVTVEFEGMMGLVLDDNASVPEDPICRFRIEGMDGLINGTVGTWPTGTGRGPGTIEHVYRGQPRFFRPDLQGTWAIDAFGATMAELMLALEEDRQPEISGRDNLDTLRIVFAAEQSAHEGRKIDPRTL